MFGDTGSNRDAGPESSSRPPGTRRQRRVRGAGGGTSIIPVDDRRIETRPRYPNIGLLGPFRIVVSCGETTALEGKFVSC